MASFNAPGARSPLSVDEELAVSVSQDWQALSSWGVPYEVKGMVAGVEAGRLSELIGLAGATGEYLGLATTASRDLGRWLAAAAGDYHWGFGTRAATERLVGYLHAASHHFGNVTLRAMLVHPHADSMLKKRERDELTTNPSTDPIWRPYSRAHASFPALNRDQARRLCREARLHSPSALTDLAEALRSVTADDVWEAMVRRRNDEYHRWRVQSVPGADPASTPWQQDGESRMLEMHQPSAAPFDPADTIRLAEEARYNLGVLTRAMGAWYDVWERSKDDLIDVEF